MRSLVSLPTALGSEERLGNMRACALHRFPKLKKLRPFRSDWLSLVCFGPSLKHTWTQVRHPVMTTSGAHNFLLDGGIVPDYHVEVDPRPHKVEFTEKANEGVHYFMASCCDPKAWENLKGKRVTVFHCYGDPVVDKWIHEQGEEGAAAAGGTTVGLRAMEVAGLLGFRKFLIHGMDCSFDQERHAGRHPNETDMEIVVKVNGRQFRTSPQLYEAAREFVELFLKHRIDAEVAVYGDGLLPELMRTMKDLKRKVA